MLVSLDSRENQGSLDMMVVGLAGTVAQVGAEEQQPVVTVA